MMKPAVRSTAAVATALTLGGCFWPAAGAGPGRTAHNPFEDTITPETVGDLEEVWTAQPAIAAPRHIVTSPGAVHVTAPDSVYALSPDDGEVLWERSPGLEDPDLPDSIYMGPSAYADGVLWISGGVHHTGRTYVTEQLDPETGEVVGDQGAGLVEGVRGEGYALTGLHVPSPDIGTVVASVRDSDDPSQGWTAPIWLTEDDGTGYERPTMTLGTDRVYQAGHGFSRDGDGSPVRSIGVRAFPTTHVEECESDAGTTVACPEWFVPFDNVTAAPVLSDDGSVVYVGSDDSDAGNHSGTVMALDTADGSIVWSVTLDGGVEVAPALADGVLYVPTDANELLAVDATDGSILWRAPTWGQVIQQPAVAGGVVFTGADIGVVEAFDAAGCSSDPCEALWSDQFSQSVTGAPAVDRGQLYIGANHGRVIAYGLPD